MPSGVPKLLQDLSSMINNPHLSDVVICLQDGQEIAAHSFILSLRSDVLAQVCATKFSSDGINSVDRWGRGNSNNKLCFCLSLLVSLAFGLGTITILGRTTLKISKSIFHDEKIFFAQGSKHDYYHIFVILYGAKIPHPFVLINRHYAFDLPDRSTL